MLRLLAIFILIFDLSGCFSSTTLHVSADRVLNVDEHAHSLPLQLRIYQLTSPQPFSLLSHHDLLINSEKALGSSYLAYREVNILPGSESTISIALLPQAKYLGVVGLFRIPESPWHYVTPISNLMLFNTIKIRLQHNHFEVDI